LVSRPLVKDTTRATELPKPGANAMAIGNIQSLAILTTFQRKNGNFISVCILIVLSRQFLPIFFDEI
jgi:hypothetical protein